MLDSMDIRRVAREHLRKLRARRARRIPPGRLSRGGEAVRAGDRLTSPRSPGSPVVSGGGSNAASLGPTLGPPGGHPPRTRYARVPRRSSSTAIPTGRGFGRPAPGRSLPAPVLAVAAPAGSARYAPGGGISDGGEGGSLPPTSQSWRNGCRSAGDASLKSPDEFDAGHANAEEV
jgi:hypothetical protein